MPEKSMKSARLGEKVPNTHRHAPLRLQNSFCEEKRRGNIWRKKADSENTSRLAMHVMALPGTNTDK
jgi:hypothetical protein